MCISTCGISTLQSNTQSCKPVIMHLSGHSTYCVQYATNKVTMSSSLHVGLRMLMKSAESPQPLLLFDVSPMAAPVCNDGLYSGSQ